LEKYREASEEDKVVMERMYGKKVLERLLAAWQKEQENERAYQNYINDNAVLLPSTPCSCFPCANVLDGMSTMHFGFPENRRMQ